MVWSEVGWRWLEGGSGGAAALSHFTSRPPLPSSLPATSTPLQPDRAVGDDDDRIGSGAITSHLVVALRLTGKMIAMKMDDSELAALGRIPIDHLLPAILDLGLWQIFSLT